MEPFELDRCGGPNQHLSLESQTGEPDKKLVLSHLCSELHGRSSIACINLQTEDTEHLFIASFSTFHQ